MRTSIELQSKSGQPLTRYFPKWSPHLHDLKAKHFVLDGELIVPVKGRLSFDDLLQRIHPAASRVEMLSRKTPAQFVLFDLLADDRGTDILSKPLKNAGLFWKNFTPNTRPGMTDRIIPHPRSGHRPRMAQQNARASRRHCRQENRRALPFR